MNPFFIGGRLKQTVCVVYVPMKSLRYIELDMNFSCGCLHCCYLFRLFHYSPIHSHLYILFHFNSGEVYFLSWIVVPTGVGVLIFQFYLIFISYHHSFPLHILWREYSLRLHCVIRCSPEKYFYRWFSGTTLRSDDHHRVISICNFQLNRFKCVFCDLIDAFLRCLDKGYTCLCICYHNGWDEGG